MLFLLIVGFIVACLAYAIFQSTIVFVIYGIGIGVLIVGKILIEIRTFHPVFFEGLILTASLITAFISIAKASATPLIISCCTIGFIKGSFIMGDADTEWYDTDYFSIDGVLYRFFDSDRSNAIMAFGVLFFVFVNFLLAVPCMIACNIFTAFIPSLVYFNRVRKAIKMTKE